MSCHPEQREGPGFLLTLAVPLLQARTQILLKACGLSSRATRGTWVFAYTSSHAATGKNQILLKACGLSSRATRGTRVFAYTSSPAATGKNQDPSLREG